MATETAATCHMCETNKMVLAPGKDGKDTIFMVCPNCDDPKGKIPSHR